LTREVFLPDQSVADTKSTPKSWQEQSRKNSVEICACLWKKTFQQNLTIGKIGAVLIWSAGALLPLFEIDNRKLIYTVCQAGRNAAQFQGAGFGSGLSILAANRAMRLSAYAGLGFHSGGTSHPTKAVAPSFSCR
jgi:hypothetical protein